MEREYAYHKLHHLMYPHPKKSHIFGSISRILNNRSEIICLEEQMFRLLGNQNSVRVVDDKCNLQLCNTKCI